MHRRKRGYRGFNRNCRPILRNHKCIRLIPWLKNKKKNYNQVHIQNYDENQIFMENRLNSIIGINIVLFVFMIIYIFLHCLIKYTLMNIYQTI